MAASIALDISQEHSGSSALTGGLWIAFRAVNAVHRGWRWYQRLNLYTNENNLFNIAGGRLLNFTLGDAPIIGTVLKVAGRTFLLATRVIECGKAISSLHEACFRWKEAVKNTYPVYVNILPPKHSNHSFFFSASTEHTVKIALRKNLGYWKRIAWRTFEVTKCLFILSMRVLDVAEAMTANPQILQEGVNDIFVNSFQLVVGNKAALTYSLKRHSTLINSIFKRMGLPYTADRIISAVQTVAAPVEFAYSVSSAASQRICSLMSKIGSMVTSFFDIRPIIITEVKPQRKYTPFELIHLTI